MISRAGLEGEWLFERASLLDTSGAGRDITNAANIGFADGGTGLDLSYVDRSVARAVSSAPIDAGAWPGFSAAWECNKAAATAGGENPRACAQWDGTNGWQIYTDSSLQGCCKFYWGGGSGIEGVAINSAVFDSTTRQYALTFLLATKGWILYRDGIAYPGASGALTNTPVLANRKLTIGNSDSYLAANGWIGFLGKFRLYSRVLTPAEVADLAADPLQTLAAAPAAPITHGMSDFLSALRAYLLGCQPVTDLLNADVNVGPTQSVYVLALPAEEIAVGPHKVVVLIASGGGLGRMRRTITEARVDIVCYGETDFEAARLDRAVSGAVKSLVRQVYANVLLHGATVASGPFQARDPEIFWPAMRRQIILRADEREVGYATV